MCEFGKILRFDCHYWIMLLPRRQNNSNIAMHHFQIIKTILARRALTLIDCWDNSLLIPHYLKAYVFIAAKIEYLNEKEKLF